MEDVLHYIHCLLKVIYLVTLRNHCSPASDKFGQAINFLHKNFIVHRVSVFHRLGYRILLTYSWGWQDLKESNTLINHFGNEFNIKNVFRRRLRASGKATYMLFDFDAALMLPRTSAQCEVRLPASCSFEISSVVWPPDTMQGELDYNPFVFEMGCLGIYLCTYFQVSFPG